MRILFVDQFSDYGGAQIGLRDIMTESKARGHDVWFAAPGSGELFDYCAASDIGTQSLPVSAYRNGSKSVGDVARFVRDMSRSAARIQGLVRDNRIDLVYVNGPRILAAAALVRCPIVFHLHSALDKRYSQEICRRMLRGRRATAITASEFVAKGLKSPSRVIYNGVRDFGFVPRPRAARVRKIAVIGRIAPEKGQLHFVEAARILERRGFEAEFLVMGATLFSNPDYERRLRDAAEGSKVEFRGWTGDIASTLHEADVVAVPCMGSECSPRIVPEAFSAGTPVVAYRSGGIPELIRHGETGLLTDHAGPEALAASIEALLTNAELSADLSLHGRAEWERRFRLDRFCNEIHSVIERGCQLESGKRQISSAIACEDYLP